MKVRLILGDCMDFMADCNEGEYSLACIDPPYGGGQHFNFRFGTGDQVYNSHKPDPLYWNMLLKLSKNQIIWGGNYFTDMLRVNRCWISWYKGQPIDSFSDFELAWTSFDEVCKAVKIESYGFNHGDKRNGFGKTIHPTQKPVALYKWLLKNYTKEGDTIFDSHGGSMSSVIACIEMGFDITCIEKDEDYFNDAVKRVQRHVDQGDMFRDNVEIEIIK